MEHKVKKLLENLTVLQRLFVISNLFFRLMVYRMLRTSPRARLHWIGGPRPRRFERPAFPLIYLIGILLFDGRDFAIWSMYAGGVAAIFLILYTAYRFIPTKTANWIGRKI